jgi:hypothetical protein
METSNPYNEFLFLCEHKWNSNRDIFNLYSSDLICSVGSSRYFMLFDRFLLLLWQLGKHQECLDDIEAALIFDYPENMRKGHFKKNQTTALSRIHFNHKSISWKSRTCILPFEHPTGLSDLFSKMTARVNVKCFWQFLATLFRNLHQIIKTCGVGEKYNWTKI